MLVGITGGMGSGKSSLARLLAERGAILVDADRVTHRVLEGEEVIKALRDAFGEGVVDTCGHLDRSEVGRRAFSSEDNWRLLNRVVRPPLAAALWEEVERAERMAAGEIVVVDAPLLFEWDSQERFDAVIVVDAEEALCIERVEQRSKLGEQEIRQRMAYQMPAAQKRELADYVVNNDGDLDDLRCQAEKIWRELVDRKNREEEGGVDNR